MRLRLLVQRHRLPPTNLLWTVTEDQTHQAFTIAKLLDEVNRVIPLEAEKWGLEDYVVDLDGFECLHFQPVCNVLKDDDKVRIRPIQTAEVRSRTLSGRYQINEGGQHLIDGLPFGRPYLRHPNRPPVNIPPPVRNRLITNGEDEVVEMDESYDTVMDDDYVGGNIPSHWKTKEVLEEDEDEDDEDDTDYIPQTQSPVESEEAPTSHKGKKRVRFDINAEDSHLPQDESNDTSDTSEDETTDSSSDMGSPIPNGLERVSASPSDVSDSSSEASSDTESTTSSDSDSGSSVSEESDAGINTTEQKAIVRPGKGRKRTRSRNDRRRRSNRLKTLKSLGLLPSSANLDDLSTWAQQRNEDRDNLVAEGRIREIEKSRAKRLASQVTTVNTKNIITFPDTNTNADEQTSASPSLETQEFERRRQELLHQLNNGGVDVTDDNCNRSTLKRKPREPAETLNSANLGLKSHDPDACEQSPAEPAPKRLRLDGNATRRLIFNQLGTRPPKNKEEEAKVRAKLMASKAKPKSKLQPEVEPMPEPIDPDRWKSRINLTAFECWHEDEELSAPPYPFKQYWDPKCKEMKPRNKNKGKKNAKTRRNDVDITYNEGPLVVEERVLKVYDDLDNPAPEMMNVESAIQLQLKQDTEPKALQDDFPSIPKDLASLPTLTQTHAKVGDVIVFKHLVVSAETNWSPEIVGPKTARIEEIDGDALALRIAQRDLSLSQKKYDSEGNRVYEKFEGLEDDDTDGPDDFLQEPFDKLLEPKLLLSAPSLKDSSSETIPGDRVDGIPSMSPPAYTEIGPVKPVSTVDGVDEVAAEQNSTEDEVMLVNG